jgi:hypothetical protein
MKQADPMPEILDDVIVMKAEEIRELQPKALQLKLDAIMNEIKWTAENTVHSYLKMEKEEISDVIIKILQYAGYTVEQDKFEESVSIHWWKK